MRSPYDGMLQGALSNRVKRPAAVLNRVLPRSQVFSSPGVYAWVDK